MTIKKVAIVTQVHRLKTASAASVYRLTVVVKMFKNSINNGRHQVENCVCIENYTCDDVTTVTLKS